MNFRSAVKILLVLVLALPVGQLVIFWIAGLLSAMGDTAASNVLGYINTAIQLTWLLCVVGLVVTLAMHSLADGREE